jgi:membrane protease YdiL (CAAX protease family)
MDCQSIGPKGEIMEKSLERNQFSIFRPQGSWKSLGVYLFITFVWTWVFLYLYLGTEVEPQRTLLIITAAFGPFLAAVATVWIFEGRTALKKWLRSIFRFKTPFYLYLAGAFAIPLLIGSLQYLVYRLLGGSPGFPSAEPWYTYLGYLIPTALLTGGNEEPGWRGYALPVLNKLTTPLGAGLALGVVHSLWHLPLMEAYNTNILLYAFNLIPLTFLFNWFYEKSRASIWPVMLFHAGTNVIARYMPTPENVLGAWGDATALRGIVYWIMALVLFIFTSKYWLKRSETGAEDNI